MASEGVKARRKVAGVLRRMLMRQLSMGFEKWQAVVQEMKNVQRLSKCGEEDADEADVDGI